MVDFRLVARNFDFSVVYALAIRSNGELTRFIKNQNENQS